MQSGARWRLAMFLLLAAGCVSPPATQRSLVNLTTSRLERTGSFGIFAEAIACSADRLGELYVLDRGTSTVIKFNTRFDSVRSAGGLGRDHFQFDQPVALDARPTNNIFVADFGNHRIEEYTRELAYFATLYTREDGTEANRFGYPQDVAIDDAGNVYLIDGENGRVLMATPDFRISRIIGSYTTATNPSAVLHQPKALTVGANNDLTVLDQAGLNLVTFDNLGNYVASSRLETPAVRIRAMGDSLFVIPQMQDQSDLSIMILKSHSLRPVGIWNVPSSELPRWTTIQTDGLSRSAIDLAVVGHTVVLLGRIEAATYRIAASAR